MAEKYNRFYAPEEVKELYSEIVPVYQAAFGGDPWYEVTKCEDPDTLQKCIGGFSALSIGEMCGMCGNNLTSQAYEPDELIQRFEEVASTRPTAWYLEGNEMGITLVALAYRQSLGEIIEEKYEANPDMQNWMNAVIGKKEICWLDEIFANLNLKPKGNLANLGLLCKGLAENLETDTFAFRTINRALVAATVRDFGNNARVFKREEEIPDRRDFVVINFNSNI